MHRLGAVVAGSLAAALQPLGALAAAPRLLLAKDAGPAAYNDCTAAGHLDPAQFPVWSGDPSTFFDDYRQLSDIARYITYLQTQYPGLVRVTTLGKSWEGRDMRALEITDYSVGLPADKPCVFIEGGIHAREWIAPATVLFLAQALLRDAAKPAVAAALKTFVFTLVAPVNPDGYVYTWEHNRMWRKTRSNRPEYACPSAADGVAGVDANRNFGFTWGKTNDADYAKDLRDPCSEVFIGPKAFSEPETKAVSDYMSARQVRSRQTGKGHVAAFLDFHSFAMVLLPPWAYTAEWPNAADKAYIEALTKSMVKAIKGASQRKFQAGPDLFPADPGTGPDWAYGELGVRATMTVELEGTSASGGFCLSRTQIRSVGEEQWASVQALAAHLLAKGHEPSKLVGMFATGGRANEGAAVVEVQQLPSGAVQPAAAAPWDTRARGWAVLAGAMAALVAAQAVLLGRWCWLTVPALVARAAAAGGGGAAAAAEYHRGPGGDIEMPSS